MDEDIKSEEPLPKEEELLQEESLPKGKPPTEFSDDPDTLQAQLGLAPKTIVLAKVKGYRAWPAMVLAYDILPENIKQMRPKSVKQSRKLKQPLIVVPVRFFSDDTYIWIKLADLKILLREDIDAFLDKRAGGKKDTLVDAYRLAQEPPDMEEFNRWGSAGPPDIPDSNEDLLEPPRKKLKLRLSIKPKETKKPANNKKPARNESEDPGYANYEEFERELDASSEDLEDLEYDSDWGLSEDDFNFETGDYIFDDDVQQKDFYTDFPRAKDLAKTLAYCNKQLHAQYKTVSPLLLDDDVDEKATNTALRATYKFIALGEVPIIAFTKSPLYRVLLLTAHKPFERFPHKQARNEIDKILKLVPLTACTLTMEDLVVPTPEETPERETQEDEGKNGLAEGEKENLNSQDEDERKKQNPQNDEPADGVVAPKEEEADEMGEQMDELVVEGDGKEDKMDIDDKLDIEPKSEVEPKLENGHADEN